MRVEGLQLELSCSVLVLGQVLCGDEYVRFRVRPEKSAMIDIKSPITSRKDWA